MQLVFTNKMVATFDDIIRLISSLLLKSDNKAGLENQGRPLLNVIFTLCWKVPSPFYKGEPSDKGFNNLIYSNWKYILFLMEEGSRK